MATVPELKATARDLKIKGFSKMAKPELIAAIAEAERKNAETRTETVSKVVASRAAIKAESVTREVSMPTEAERAAARRTASLIAGDKGKRTAPMSNAIRQAHYHGQNGYGDTFKATPAQTRRMIKKGNKATVRRVLATFDEMIADARKAS